jgi:ABC-type dipeptide/oligopeptide/nickel transport system permease component
MLTYIVKRLLGMIPTLLLVSVVVFLFVHMLPGDPARLAAGQEADQATVELVRKELGLDLPLPQQFVRYFGHMLQGDLGISLRTKRPVSTEIAERFMPTLWLTITSMIWSVTFGMILMSAVPIADPARRHLKRALLSDEIPSPIRKVGDEPVVQPLVQVAPGHFVARHAVGGAY